VLDHDRSLESSDGWDPASIRTGQPPAIDAIAGGAVAMSGSHLCMQMSGDGSGCVI
jgi:hypothetical protein